MGNKFDNIMEMRRRMLARHPRHIESSIQQCVVRWFRAKYPKYIIAAVPNGGFRNAREAAVMRREGVLAGFSDLIVIAEQNVLFVEMKTSSGRQSERQKDFQEKVELLGHQYSVCHSFDEAEKCIDDWLQSINQKA